MCREVENLTLRSDRIVTVLALSQARSGDTALIGGSRARATGSTKREFLKATGIARAGLILYGKFGAPVGSRCSNNRLSLSTQPNRDNSAGSLDRPA